MSKLHSQCPDVLIIGAQRCGTTWLAEALRGVEGVWVPPKLKPEPKIFVNCHDCATKKGRTIALTERLEEAGFLDAPTDRLILDKSTRYLADYAAPIVAQSCNPDMKIIVMLRNPADRAWSHWRYTKEQGREPASFADAVSCEPARSLALNAPEIQHKIAYIGNGMYGFHLAHWLQSFEPEQFLVIFFEELDKPNELMTGKVMPWLSEYPLLPDLGVGHSGDAWPTPKNVGKSFEEEVDQTVWETQDLLETFFRRDQLLLRNILCDTLGMDGNPYLQGDD